MSRNYKAIEWEKSGLDAALDKVLAENLTINDMCERLGVSNSALYNRLKERNLKLKGRHKGRRPGFTHSPTTRERIAEALRQSYARKTKSGDVRC